MVYPGGKGMAGVWQRIINQMPPHECYVEPFVGSGTVLRYKRPAARSYAIDRDPGAIAALSEVVLPPGVIVICGDGIRWLARRRLPVATFVYCDPPYLPSTRSHRRIYRCELSEEGHGRLLDVLTRLPVMVAVSGYPSRLYDRRLRGWRSIEYRVMTRGGIRDEVLWMNYPEPVELHDYRFLGETFREREKFRRQQRRWAARLAKMDRLQRLALAAGLAVPGDGRPSP